MCVLTLAVFIIITVVMAHGHYYIANFIRIAPDINISCKLFLTLTIVRLSDKQSFVELGFKLVCM